MKGFALFLSVLVFCCAVPFSTATTISNALDLVKYFQRPGQSTITGYLELTADIDFSEVSIDYALGEYSGSCIPFTGSVNGNGHAIKNYKMKSRLRAGLFCEIGTATIQNLVIDKSCSFDGTNASALSSSVRNSVSLTNVISMATVSGSSSVGGFVSRVFGSTGVRITMNKCQNEGKVISTSNTTRSGGLIGDLSNNPNLHIEIRETSFSGILEAPLGGSSGGLIGFVDNNLNMNLVIHKCQSHSETTFSGADFDYWNYGGLIGLMSRNSHMKTTVEDSTTSGFVNGKVLKEAFVGGLIGKMVRNDYQVMSCARNDNRLNITVEIKSYAGVGGFIGWADQNPSSQMIFENNQNNGNISVTSKDNYVGGLIGYFRAMVATTLSVSSFTQAGTISVHSAPGTLWVGGLVGLITEPSSCGIRFRNVRCNGTILTKSAFHSYVGSFVGSVAHSHKTTFEMNDAIFSGTLTAISLEAHYSYVGGIVGHIFFSVDSTLVLSSCVNRGPVTSVSKSLYHYLSGFVSLFSYNNNTSFSILNSVHDGPVQEQNAMGECYYGGYIAEANNNYDTDIVFSNATNNGKWHIKSFSEESRFAGFVGKMRSENSFPVRLHIIHSINKQSLSHSNGPACGLFCVDPRHYVGIQTTVTNSINKGDISGTNAYGISTSVSYASSVVSTGTSTGTVNSFSLWGKAVETQNVYVLDKACKNCQSAKQFTQSSTGDYVIVGSNQRVDDLLNTLSVRNQYPIVWTRKLELTAAVRAIIGAPINKTVYIVPGSTLKTLLQISPFNTETLIPVNKTNHAQLDMNSIFHIDTFIALCYRVTLNGTIDTVTLIEHGTKLGKDKTLSQYLKSEYVFVDTFDFDVIYSSGTMVVEPMNITILKVVRVVLELPNVQQTKVVPKQIRSEISTLMKKSLPRLLVTSQSNEHGLVSRIDILVQDVETAREIVTAINGIRGKENCSGILCLCTIAYLEDEKPSFSASSSLSMHALSLTTLAVLLISALFQ